MNGEKTLQSLQLISCKIHSINLVRTFVYRPEFLLLDEPLLILDAELREEMRFGIKELQRELTITALYLTNGQGEALA